MVLAEMHRAIGSVVRLIQLTLPTIISLLSWDVHVFGTRT